MIINRIIKIILIVLGISFVALEALEYAIEASGVSAFMFVLLMVLYCRVTKIKERLFFSFLLIFSIAHFYSFISWFLPYEENTVDYGYYLTNLLYMLSYTFLIALVVKEMNFKKILSRFTITIVILIILNVFCVTLVTDTASSVLSLAQYILEFTYNAIVMLLLSVSLIHYMNRDDNKSMLFLVGSIFIFFSEMIQLAYYYISHTNDLGAIYSIFLVLAFTFFYLQSKLDHVGSVEDYFNEGLTS
ncbi:hypothetical protein [Winogradskyella immobilis]|uniref:Uncharacterized protein n=1 Tax=Winogradskyella immobilis TaxID=2816852 RepID=A0ABS8ENI8_9FLAO|nr:hypothetical protein [Winogradskyella immobilis]MCC1484794.1 hypothetical protein [Winogradskyella immobilis]MCG0016886.1 hypothetical protein [Winogradskyella immobilis]